jgi:plastocyanin
MKRDMRQRLIKLGTVAVLGIGVFAAGLLNRPSRTLAQDVTHNTYMVSAGAFSSANAELLAFAPSYLKVHRGDSVMWHINSFHNVHIGENPADMVVVQEIDGKPTPVINPSVAFGNIKTGETYKGGDVSNGIGLGPDASPVFTVVIDMPVGVYTYFCDIHPGMTGIIEVVPDDEVIPAPAEVDAAAQDEISGQFMAATPNVMAKAAEASPVAQDGVLTVSLGVGNVGRVYYGQFLPYFGAIKAGESVTWENPADSIEAHFVNALPYDDQTFPDFAPLPPAAEGQPPVFALGLGFLGSTQTGATVAKGDVFNSTAINPGQSFTLTFKDPGVYAYTCHIHPGMNGVIVVEPVS